MGASTNPSLNAGSMSLNLFEFLPVLPSKESPKSGGERWPFVVSGIRMENESAFWCRQGSGFIVRYFAAHQGCCDVLYLVSVNESQAMLSGHGDAIKEVKFWDLQDVFDGAELSSAGTENWRSVGQGLIRNGPSFVHEFLFPVLPWDFSHDVA